MMNIQAEKLELMEMLLKTENEAVLKKIRSIFNSSKGNARITIEQYNKEIEAAESRIKKGKFVRHEDVVRESEKW
jgi:hypothetical protein